jgi:myo-inositol-1-phosphate synthase
MGEGAVRVALVGIGNCAAVLLQGRSLYAKESSYGGGCCESTLLAPVDAVKFVAAFDVDARKVGLDLADAIRVEPNNAPMLVEIPRLGVSVDAGPPADGLGPRSAAQVPDVVSASVADVTERLVESRADTVVSLLPAGSQQATEVYASAALEAGCGFVNCAPTRLARLEGWRSSFHERGFPLIGDDLAAQLGATIVHQTLTKMLVAQGIEIDQTYQINAGGNMNFVNLADGDRAAAKASTKAAALTSGGTGLRPENCYVGTADYIPFLADRKVAYVRIEGRMFGGLPVGLELRLDVPDSANAAGRLLDAMRLDPLLRRSGDARAADAASALLMKEPALSMPAAEARAILAAAIQPHDTATAAARG